jgi:hypothetical protein
MKTLSIKSKKCTASIVVMFSLLLLLSCDNRFSELENIAPVVPQVFLKGNPLIKTLNDSVKVGYVQFGAKNTYEPYQVGVHAKSNGSSNFLTSLIGEKQVKINGLPVASTNNFTFQDSTHFNYSIRPDSIGSYQVVFKVTDSKSNSDEASVTITAFDNLLPVASFSVSYSDKTSDKHSFKLDASKSFDRDAKFGGKIISYSWFVNNQFPTNSNPVLYTTLQNGTYLIGMGVTDNDYGVSKIYSILLVVNENSITTI